MSRQFKFQGATISIPPTQKIIEDGDRKVLLVQALGQKIPYETAQKKGLSQLWLAVDLDGKVPGRLTTRLILE